jgi:SAM-dependent methyltransferase
MTPDPNDTTLAAYQAAADRYIENSVPPPPAVLDHLDRLAGLVGRRHVLELGSGPGRDAAYLEQRGVQVTRSEATPAFVERLRSAGHERGSSMSATTTWADRTTPCWPTPSCST